MAANYSLARTHVVPMWSSDPQRARSTVRLIAARTGDELLGFGGGVRQSAITTHLTGTVGAD